MWNINAFEIECHDKEFVKKPTFRNKQFSIFDLNKTISEAFSRSLNFEAYNSSRRIGQRDKDGEAGQGGQIGQAGQGQAGHDQAGQGGQIGQIGQG